MYISALVLKCGICDSWILLNSHRFVAHPCFRAGRRSENLKGGGAISNTRSFYGACFVSRLVKIWRGPLCPPGSVGSALLPKEQPTKNS